MAKLPILTASEQVANHLRREIESGTWEKWLPGEARLSRELSVGRDTIRAALRQLENEGWLIPTGQGRRRIIVLPAGSGGKVRKVRIRILLYEKENRGDLDNATLLSRLQEAGFTADFAGKSLYDLGMKVEKVARFVGRNPADAWVISAGSREINEWFSQQEAPAIAMYGRFRELPIAAAFTTHTPSLITAVRSLVDLGHKRIVMLTRRERRVPQLARPEQTFIDELEACGISTGSYNLPDWEEKPEGLNRMLDELFRFSPPTALIIQEAPIFVATRQHLSDCSIVAPRDVSLIAADPDPSFTWCEPVISHFSWDHRPLVRRVVRWAENVARGKQDRRQSGVMSKFVEGGTIGPVSTKR